MKVSQCLESKSFQRAPPLLRFFSGEFFLPEFSQFCRVSSNSGSVRMSSKVCGTRDDDDDDDDVVRSCRAKGISLESLNPKTLNTRLNKSSLRETLHLLLQLLNYLLYYLLAISALSITITYTLLLSIARTSKQEYYSYITNYLVALD